MKRKAPAPPKEVRGPVGFANEIWVAVPLARAWQLVTRAAWLSRWFTSEASGDLDEPGKITLSWGKDHEDILIVKVSREKRVEFLWQAYGVPYATRTAIVFAEKKGMARVRVEESGWKRDPKGIESALHHAEGWAVFLCQLKAFAQFGVELRGS